MKRPNTILLTLSILLIAHFNSFSQKTCLDTSEITLYKDSIKSAYRVMDKTLILEESSCNTFILDLGHEGIQLHDVYELCFYSKANKSSTISISFLSQSDWSQEITHTINETEGYKRFPISVLGENSTNLSSMVQQIKITILSDSSVTIEELEFYFIKPKNIPVKGLTKERQKEINATIKKHNEGEEKASRRIERRKNKKLYSRESSN